MGVSLILSTLFLVRDCVSDNKRIDRDTAIYSGVRRWAHEAGAGDVMFGTVDSRPIAGDAYLVEGSVYRSLTDPSASPVIYHWICTHDGTVVQAFGQAEWGSAKTREWSQTAEPGR